MLSSIPFFKPVLRDYTNENLFNPDKLQSLLKFCRPTFRHIYKLVHLKIPAPSIEFSSTKSKQDGLNKVIKDVYFLNVVNCLTIFIFSY